MVRKAGGSTLKLKLPKGPGTGGSKIAVFRDGEGEGSESSLAVSTPVVGKFTPFRDEVCVIFTSLDSVH